jgi:hypothetical protein
MRATKSKKTISISANRNPNGYGLRPTRPRRALWKRALSTNRGHPDSIIFGRFCRLADIPHRSGTGTTIPRYGKGVIASAGFHLGRVGFLSKLKREDPPQDGGSSLLSLQRSYIKPTLGSSNQQADLHAPLRSEPTHHRLI